MRISNLFFLACPRKNQRKTPADSCFYPHQNFQNGHEIKHVFHAASILKSLARNSYKRGSKQQPHMEVPQGTFSCEITIHLVRRVNIMSSKAKADMRRRSGKSKRLEVFSGCNKLGSIFGIDHDIFVCQVASPDSRGSIVQTEVNMECKLIFGEDSHTIFVFIIRV